MRERKHLCFESTNVSLRVWVLFVLCYKQKLAEVNRNFSHRSNMRSCKVRQLKGADWKTNARMDSVGLTLKFLSERVYLFTLLLCILCWKHYLVQKNGKVKEGLFAIKIFFVENRKFNSSLSYYKEKWTTFPNCFCTRKCFYIFGGKFANKSSLIFLLKKLPGETLCKSLQIFPPKVLVYIRVDFSRHLIN